MWVTCDLVKSELSFNFWIKKQTFHLSSILQAIKKRQKWQLIWKKNFTTKVISELNENVRFFFHVNNLFSHFDTQRKWIYSEKENKKKKTSKLRQGNSSVAMSPPKIRNEIIFYLQNVHTKCNSCLTQFLTNLSICLFCPID